MVIAAELRTGMVIRVGRQIYKVLEVESKAGPAQVSGVVKPKLSNIKSGRLWEPHFRPQEHLEDLQLERRTMEFLFGEADTCTLMDPRSFEQTEVPRSIFGPAGVFLQPGTQLPVEFFEGQPISIVLPDVAEAQVISTAPATRSPQANAWKEATLDNGLRIRVPLFISRGEMVRVDVKTGHYIERVRGQHKRSA